MIVDTIGNAGNTRGLRPRIDAALDYLARTARLDAPLGRQDIDGDRVYALVQEYATLEPAGRQFESHRRYIDVQYVQRGGEIIYWAPTARLRKGGAYAADKDATLYDDGIAESAATPIELEAGSFAVFFPEDAHLPCCRRPSARGGEPVRKIVVKVLL